MDTVNPRFKFGLEHILYIWSFHLLEKSYEMHIHLSVKYNTDTDNITIIQTIVKVALYIIYII